MPFLEDLRAEPPLTGQDLVVRGGQMRYENVAASLARCYRIHGVYALSTGARAGAALEEICAKPPLSKYRELQIARFDDIQQLGWPYLPTGKAPHWSLLLPGPLTDASWEQLVRLFNPHSANDNW